MKKRTPPLAVRLVASLMALAALGTGLVADVDPSTCLLRAGAAYLAGRALAGLWTSFFGRSDEGVTASGEESPEAPPDTDVEPVAA